MATYFIEAVNTTSKELDNMAIEATVWDLEGECQYSEIFDKLTLPCKTTLSIAEMKYPKSEIPKPVYFLLLKLYRKSDNKISSRNFYWLHLPDGDYKLLEPYKSKKVTLKMTSLTFIRGSSYEVRMHVENTSKKPDFKSLLFKNNRDFEFEPEVKQGNSLLQKIVKKFSTGNNGTKVTEINGSNAEVGVAFLLHFSVHDSEKDEKNGEDTRILPVHYSDNYFLLVPGEVMTISLKSEIPWALHLGLCFMVGTMRVAILLSSFLVGMDIGSC